MIKLDGSERSVLFVRGTDMRRGERADFNRWIGARESSGDADVAPAQPHGAAAADDDGARMPAGTDLTLEFDLVSDAGDEQRISVPWRLSAAGRLSHLMRTDPEPASASWRDGQTVMRVVEHDIPAVVLPCEVDRSSATRDADGRAATLATTIPTASATSAVDAPIAQAGAVSTASAGSEPWAKRLLRWVDREGAEPTLWIRDYRLDPQAAQRLGELARSLASECGQRLQRIYVNGRPHWSADQSPTQEYP